MTTRPQDDEGDGPPTDLPGLERVVYNVRGPHTLRYADRDGIAIDGSLAIIHERQTEGRNGDGAGPRAWTVEFAVDRFHLLPLSQAGIVGLTPVDIIGYNIADPVTLTFQPKRELARELDAIEDGEPVVSPATRLIDGRVRMKLFDLRNLSFVRARQDRSG